MCPPNSHSSRPTRQLFLERVTQRMRGIGRHHEYPLAARRLRNRPRRGARSPYIAAFSTEKQEQRLRLAGQCLVSKLSISTPVILSVGDMESGPCCWPLISRI